MRRQIRLNGAAARLVSRGDKAIIVSYASYDEQGLDPYSPLVAHVDRRNRIVEVDSNPEVLLDGEVPGALTSEPDGPREVPT